MDIALRLCSSPGRNVLVACIAMETFFTEAGSFSRFKIRSTSHSQQDNGLCVAGYVAHGRYGSLGRKIACVALEENAYDGHGRHHRSNMYR